MAEKTEELIRFSKWLRGRLLELSMSARDLSIVSGVDESEVSKMTRGVRLPSLLAAKMMIPHLKCSAHDFLVAVGLQAGSLADDSGLKSPSERKYTKQEVEAILRKAGQAALDLLDAS
ncbi:MAG: hypothetical protein HQL19_04500 [Candidatus Omnitrophica bacterium]|nr:hypothetical protein [Candidatus Omnitrophota bacterium]